MLRLSNVKCWKLSENASKALISSGIRVKNIASTRWMPNDERTAQNSQLKADLALKEYSMFYKFPYVHIFGTVNKLKKYSSVLTVIGLPSSVLLSSLNLMDNNFFLTFLALGIATNGLLYSVGILSYKVIGAIYLSSDETTVKISYLNFWGKRMDIYCPVDDIVPISEVTPHYILPHIMFKQYSTSRELFLPHTFGKVLNKDTFIKTFGSLRPS